MGRRITHVLSRDDGPRTRRHIVRAFVLVRTPAACPSTRYARRTPTKAQKKHGGLNLFACHSMSFIGALGGKL